MRQQGAHAHILADTQHVVGHKDGDKHGGDRVADKLQQHIQRAAFGHIQFGDGFYQHQADRQQHRKQRGAQRRQGLFFAHFEIGKLSWHRFKRQAVAEQPQEQRAADQ